MNKTRFGAKLVLTAVIAAIGCWLIPNVFRDFFISPSYAERDANGTYHPAHRSIEYLCVNYPLIVIGEVQSIDASPGCWSGFAKFTKEAKYSVLKVLKGDYGEKTITVRHLIVCPTKRVTDQAGLSKEFFAPGSKVTLCLRKEVFSSAPGKPVESYYEDDENEECVQQLTPELEKQFIQTLTGKAAP